MENRDAGSAKQVMTGAARGGDPARGAARGPVTIRREPLPPRAERPALPATTRDLAPLTGSAGEILDAGLARLGLGLPPGARVALVDHIRLLLAWTPHINLTAVRDPDAVVREHVLDSLAGVSLLRSAGLRRLLDLGSGGGFPGLPLAIAMPEAPVLLVESIAKKSRFLQTVVDAIGVGDRVRVVTARAESLAGDDGSGVPVEAVCVRAVADLGRLAALAGPLVAPGGALVAWKRGDLAAEVAAAASRLAAAGFDTPTIHPVDVAGLEDHRLVMARRADRPAAAARSVVPGLPSRRRW